MNGNEEKKEYRKPELVYIAFDDSVIVASSMGEASGDIEDSDQPLGFSNKWGRLSEN